MKRVPCYRCAQSGIDCECVKDGHIVRTDSPRPVTSLITWDEVSGDPELVRALERCCFRSALGDERLLSGGVPVALKELEQQLRLTGFVRANERLLQTEECSDRFRVKVIDRTVDDCCNVHGVRSFVCYRVLAARWLRSTSKANATVARDVKAEERQRALTVNAQRMARRNRRAF